MNERALQIFLFAAIPVFTAATIRSAPLSTGATYSLSFIAINGNKLSTADGHVTVVVLATTADREKAHAVGERVPDFCLGNPNYRMVTVIRFTSRRGPVVRKIAAAVVKHRVNEEADRLQARYDAKKIARDAHQDIFIVTDFDGSASAQFGLSAESTEFGVFVFGGNGRLRAEWHGVPSTEQLASVLK